ncbi:MAG: DUF2927 domain-containing protein [Mangrovicoccus sp.]|nr:DUF2927 domain-containing protein [Mangrovicoccus sp.]
MPRLRLRDHSRGLIGLLGVLVLTACAPELQFADLSMPRPEARPDLPLNGRPEIAAGPLDTLLLARYAETEKQLSSRGLLRTDAGASPVDPDDLAENFLRIALYDEYSEIGGRIVAREQASSLRRWEDPVSLTLHFGASVPAEDQARDRAEVSALSKRLSAATGHPITLASQGGNFDVFVVSEGERQALGPALEALVPGLPDSVTQQITDLPESIFCLVVAFSDQQSRSVYKKAIAVIRAELPPLLRQSCYNEEIAQGLGLANDSRDARPSLFNDDKEFALLTGQDEFLLNMLYDPRLRPGMSIEEARPVAREIARELLPPPPNTPASAPSSSAQET